MIILNKKYIQWKTKRNKKNMDKQEIKNLINRINYRIAYAAKHGADCIIFSGEESLFHHMNYIFNYYSKKGFSCNKTDSHWAIVIKWGD